MSEQTSNHCTWVRLRDVRDPLELRKVQFQIGCNGRIANGPYPIYPDYCPHCEKAVAVIQMQPVEAAAPQAPVARLMIDADCAGVKTMYAPFLPPGEYDVYCESEKIASYIRQAETSPHVETPDWRKLPFHPSLIPALRRAASGGDQLCGAAADALDAMTQPRLIGAGQITSRQLQPANPSCCPFHWGAECIGRCIDEPGQKPWNERPENKRTSIKAEAKCTDCNGAPNSTGKIQHKPGCSVEWTRDNGM